MSWLSNTNPVLVKELRGRMRGSRAFVILTLFLLAQAVPTTLLYIVSADNVQFNAFNAGQTIGKTLFIGIVVVTLVQILIVVPGQAASALTSEKERETYDLLISTLLPPWKIVIGKLLAALAYAILLIIAVIPFMAVLFFFGGVSAQEFVLALLGLLVTVILFGSSGLLWSTIMRRSLASTIVTQAVTVVVLLGIPFLMVIFALLFLGEWPQPDWIHSRPFVYAWILFMSFHPFIALGSSEVLLSLGQTSVFVPIDQVGSSALLLPFDGGNQAPNFLVPQPWLVFTIEALLASVILIGFSIRLLRPINDGPRRGKRKRRRKPTDQ